MALGKRPDSAQQPLFVSAVEVVAHAPAHPYYDAVNKVLATHHFDRFVEGRCAAFYAKRMGRPGLPPGVYFRCLVLGYLEGIDSERGIAWRVADSLSLKSFLGYALDERTPDHSTLSRTRRLISVEAHAEVFQHLLKMLANHGLLGGDTLGADSTTLEANAAMRSLVRRDTGEGYHEFLTRLAKESGIETPTREDLARIDKTRKNKASNDDWQNPHDPDAKVTQMKDGSTHLAHKAEHAIDLGVDAQGRVNGAIVAVNLCDASVGDTNTLVDTLVMATANLAAVADDPRVADKVDGDAIVSELIDDKGYHSKQLMKDCLAMGIRTYTSEPKRKDHYVWNGDAEARDATHGNRRRIKGDRGKELLKRRGELVERSFAHCYETGAMRHLYLRKRDNAAKRVLIQAAGFNIGLMMRVSYGLAKPRNATAAAFLLLWGLWAWLARLAQAAGSVWRDRHGNPSREKFGHLALAA